MREFPVTKNLKKKKPREEDVLLWSLLEKKRILIWELLMKVTINLIFLDTDTICLVQNWI